MTLSDLSSIVGVISGLAVLGSLVYLAQQTRQNAKHTRALIQQGRAEQIIAATTRMAENVSLTALRMRGGEGDTTLDRVQLHQYFAMMGSVFFTWEDQFYQNRDGLLDGNRYAGSVKAIEIEFQRPGVRLVYKQMRPYFAHEFQSFLDGVMDRTRVATSPDRVALWKGGIEAELSGASA